MDSTYINPSEKDMSGQPVDRLKLLYPNVDEKLTPLPRSWSSQEKCNSIGLTQNNLRVHYKGVGKSHNDAASVRTPYPIPAACGLYYFEVKIISKGRDGYMGIGLTAQNFKSNRLPGWDKQSYGYHGDDGNSFSSSGNGKSYGPTFTTDDIIGCGVNLVTNTCFYTKNGHNLGIAFQDLPSKLYPTVGLQTPGEIVDANFGQQPFVFDIEDMLKELRESTKASILKFPLADDQGDWTIILNKMVSSYLVHHGYSSTAESFAKATEQNLNEEMTSIKTRQKILKLVMSGRMGLAIEHTLRSYPGLLENNQNLLFMLKCRQFVEMVNGSDFENGTSRSTTSNPVQTSVIQSTKSYQNGSQTNNNNGINNNANNINNNIGPLISESPTTMNDNPDINNIDNFSAANSLEHLCEPLKNNCNHDDVQLNNQINTANNNDFSNDVEMENGHNVTNGNSHKNGTDSSSINHSSIDTDEDMVDVDLIPNRKTSKSGVERMLEFGRELFQMSQRLEKENGANETNRKMLEDAFSLLAYSNPWSSPMGWQLCPSRREIVCAALNSAILESMNYSWRPPLEVCVAHACELLHLMASSSIGSCAFASIDSILDSSQ
ncbi:ran-binding proteins 9/10 homolog isoform X1 [Sitodiplosis mosellana]|uniref:ran-binding proteins 9/10 homolog isoform X1 n=1 Tax=Sitodiplosis mosellana TaxID=263140 RepID=UPI0024442964|nr:ran-binding proteins 9/10 homolog isoform X1 [Sitodiplosis mosellana]